jgi:uncharacterized HAD superfamily protein
MRTPGDRFNEGKLRLDLITPEMTEGLGRVLTHGATKYQPRNWQKGLHWTGVLASLKRHITAFERGEDYDPETGCLHMEHAMVNAGFLVTYYKHKPEFDDRPVGKPRIALDIDGVIANFKKSYCERNGITPDNYHWHFTYNWKQDEGIFEDKDFWMNIEPLIEGEKMPFEPVCYVSSRKCPTEWTMEWLEAHGFPCEPVYSNHSSKVKILSLLYEDNKFDYFVDDAYKHYLELNQAGIPTFLYDRPYNRKFDVGHKRIKDLSELL